VFWWDAKERLNPPIETEFDVTDNDAFVVPAARPRPARAHKKRARVVVDRHVAAERRAAKGSAVVDGDTDIDARKGDSNAALSVDARGATPVVLGVDGVASESVASDCMVRWSDEEIAALIK
jgi:hypothetical protein